MHKENNIWKSFQKKSLDEFKAKNLTLTMPLASPFGKQGDGKYVDQGPSARPEMRKGLD